MFVSSARARLPLFTVCLVSLTRRCSSSHAVEAWKVMGGFGSDGQDASFKNWESHDAELHNFLKESIPEALAHTGSITFDEHLKGVQSVLRVWGSDQAICDAGLFHSIYGTEGFQGYKLSFSRRPDIRKLIGVRAEKLAWMFCVVDRYSVDCSLYNRTFNPENIGDGKSIQIMDMKNDFENENQSENNSALEEERKFQFTSRRELGSFKICLKDEDEWLDFLELTLADWLEQVEGAAEKENPLFEWKTGQSWSYRRLAYEKMAQILAEKRAPRLEKAQRMFLDVYSKEPSATRMLHQIRTPPMCQAAKDAIDAIRSIDA